MEISGAISLVGIAAAWIFGARALWWGAGEAQSPGLAKEEARRSIQSLLDPLRADARTRVWAGMFQDVVNRVFTRRQWTIRCFARSVATSLLAIVIGTAVLAMIRPLEVFAGYAKSSWVGLSLHGVELLWVLAANFMALWWTRLNVDWLRAVNRQRTRLILLGALFLGYVALALAVHVLVLWLENKVLVAVMSVTGRTPEFEPKAQPLRYFLRVAWRVLTAERGIRPEWLITTPIMWSTFCVGIWMLHYLAAVVVLVIGARWSAVLTKLNKYVEVRDRPFHALALVLIGVWSLLLALVWMTSGWLFGAPPGSGVGV